MTSAERSEQTFQSMCLRSLTAMMAFVGYPSSRDTGEMSALLFVKLSMAVNTSVLANPQIPLMKKDKNDAMIQRSMADSSFVYSRCFQYSSV